MGKVVWRASKWSAQQDQESCMFATNIVRKLDGLGFYEPWEDEHTRENALGSMPWIKWSPSPMGERSHGKWHGPLGLPPRLGTSSMTTSCDQTPYGMKRHLKACCPAMVQTTWWQKTEPSHPSSKGMEQRQCIILCLEWQYHQQLSRRHCNCDLTLYKS
jgi:hypothetical protein